MEVLLLGDMHLHPHKGDMETLLIAGKIWEKIIKYSHDTGTPIWFLGDLVDKDSYVHKRADKIIRDALVKYPKAHIIGISGNHDQYGYNYIDAPAISYLEGLHYNNFHLLDDKKITEIQGDFAVHGIPYYHRPEDFYKALQARVDDLDPMIKNFLLIHQTPTGLIDMDIPVQIDVDHRLFTYFDMVFSGHIHSEQEITDRFHMVGNSVWSDSTDYGVEKFAILFNTETFEKQYILTDYREAPQKMEERVRQVDDIEVPSVIAGMDNAEQWEQTIRNYAEQQGADEETTIAGVKIIKECLT